MAIDPAATSGLLKLLPSIFSEDPFLGRFLLAFEQVLTGFDGGEPVPADGLEETIAGIASLFDARKTREDFIPWLAGWVALGLRADWSVAQKRDFLAKIVPLYRRRGTRENLADMLRIYTGLTPVITGVEESDFQIGVHSTIGRDTFIDGMPPHRFHVSVTMPNPDLKTLQRQTQIARALIDLQKPAHTTYDLTVVFNTLQIGIERSDVMTVRPKTTSARTNTPAAKGRRLQLRKETLRDLTPTRLNPVGGAQRTAYKCPTGDPRF